MKKSRTNITLGGFLIIHVCLIYYSLVAAVPLIVIDREERHRYGLYQANNGYCSSDQLFD